MKIRNIKGKVVLGTLSAIVMIVVGTAWVSEDSLASATPAPSAASPDFANVSIKPPLCSGENVTTAAGQYTGALPMIVWLEQLDQATKQWSVIADDGIAVWVNDREIDGHQQSLGHATLKQGDRFVIKRYAPLDGMTVTYRLSAILDFIGTELTTISAEEAVLSPSAAQCDEFASAS